MSKFPNTPESHYFSIRKKLGRQRRGGEEEGLSLEQEIVLCSLSTEVLRDQQEMMQEG